MARSAIENYVAVTQVPESGPDDYVNEKLLTQQQGGRTVFGGLLVSQAISAASATVSAGFHVYSSQSSWLRPISEKAKGKVAYHVERTADGRSYATRLVRATADDACVYIAIISFQNYKTLGGNVLTYNTPRPEFDVRPEEIPEDASAKFTESQVDQSNGSMQPFTPEEQPFDWRPSGFVASADPTEIRLRGFVRANPVSTRSASVHLAGLAYASDELLAGVAVYANPHMTGKGGRNVAVIASLTHNVSFHDPSVQIDEWMVAERQTNWGANGRVLVHQRIWDMKSERLFMTVEQEALIRLKNARL